MNNKLTLRPLKVAQVFLVLILAVLTISSKSAAQSGYYATGAYAGPSYDQARAKYEQDMAEYQRRLAVYNQQMADYQARKIAYDRHMAAQQAPAPRPAPVAAPAAGGNYLRFDGRYASAPLSLPAPVQHAVNAVNQIQDKPYRRGGGHASVNDNAYDCSGSVSYALIQAGLLRAPLSSGAFATYGQPGAGRFITIYVEPVPLLEKTEIALGAERWPRIKRERHEDTKSASCLKFVVYDRSVEQQPRHECPPSLPFSPPCVQHFLPFMARWTTGSSAS